MVGEYRVLREFPPREIEARWRACIERADVPSHYASPEYFLEPLAKAQRPFAILAEVGDEVGGVLTGVHIDRHVMCGLAPRPQICLRNDADMAATLQTLARGLLAEARTATLITLYTWGPAGNLTSLGFRETAEEGVVMLDLTQGAPALFKRFSSNRRININKAIRNGIEVFQASDEEDFRAYYEIYRTWCQRKKLPIQPVETVLSMLRLTGNRRLFLARANGKVVAGITLRFSPKGLVEYAANSSLEEALVLRPNDLLHWRAIEWACDAGLRLYSLGGAHLFLRKFGGSVVPTYRYRLDRSFLRAHDVRDALTEHGRSLFHRLPQALQAPIRRLLPQAHGT